MLTKSNDGLLEQLSAMVDGELEPADVARICAASRDDAQLRDRWHAYHLIGDVLRSEDLAAGSTHDGAFIAALRARLTDEPVVLAPEPMPSTAAVLPPGAYAARRRAWAWKAPAAVAAGFVAVAGVLTVVRTPGPDGTAGPMLAQSAAPTPAAAPRAALPQAFMATGRVVRDARLDRYLNAHKQFAGTSALGMPSGFLRNAAVEVPNR